MPNGDLYKSHVKSAILHESIAWFLKEMGILLRTERSIMREMCGVQHKIDKDLQI